MKVVTSAAKLGFVLSLVAVLTACGDAPSDAEVRKALEEQIQSETEQLKSGLKESGLDGAMAGMMPKIDNISPQGCKAAGNDIYNCTVEAAMTIMGNKQTNMHNISLKKNKDGAWKVVR